MQKPVLSDETSATAPPPASPSRAIADAPPNPAAANEVPPSKEATPAVLTLEQHLQDLRRQVQRVVKAPGAPLQSAPFHTATTLQSLPAGTEVLIVVSTPYWLGVETHEGQHGWIMRDQLEQVP